MIEACKLHWFLSGWGRRQEGGGCVFSTSQSLTKSTYPQKLECGFRTYYSKAWSISDKNKIKQKQSNETPRENTNRYIKTNEQKHSATLVPLILLHHLIFLHLEFCIYIEPEMVHESRHRNHLWNIQYLKIHLLLTTP